MYKRQGYDQALSLFLNHQAAMMVDNSMGLAKIEASGVDLTNLKTFYMPLSLIHILTRSNKLTNMKLQRIDVL